MTCTATRACAVWAVAIAAITRLPSLDGFSPSAAAAGSQRRVSGSSKHSSYVGRTMPPVPSISHNKDTSFVQLAASREELESMTVKDLRQTVGDSGLPVKGLSNMRKADLVEFLLRADEGGAGEEERAVAEQEPVVAVDKPPVEEEPKPELKPEPIQPVVEPVADDPSSADATSPDFKEEVVSPGVETLREFLTYSDYGIRKLQDQRRRGEAIRADIDDGKRDMPAYYYEDFIEEEEDREDDPNVIVADEWGTWDERDLAGPPMADDWDREKDPNPNALDPEFEYVTEIPKDEEGVEEGYDPMFGSWCRFRSLLWLISRRNLVAIKELRILHVHLHTHTFTITSFSFPLFRIRSNLTTIQRQTPSMSVP